MTGLTGKPDSTEAEDALSHDDEAAVQAPYPHDARLQRADELSSHDQEDHPVM